MLIVGGGVPGLALAALLRRAGYDPVVVDGRSPGPRPHAVRLPRSALAVLDRAGVGAAARDDGVAVDDVAVVGSGDDRTLARDESAPVVVDGGTLRRRLRDRVPRTHPDRDVAGITPRRETLAVEFATGVSEPFDLVVVAGAVRSLAGDGSGPAPDPPRLLRAEARVDLPDVDHPVDVRRERSLGQLVPLPGDRSHLLRVTATDRGDASDAGTSPDPAAVLDALDRDAPATAVRDVRRGHHPQATAPDGAWAGRRIARCGAAALPVAPATGLRTALALADVRALVDELVRTPRSLPGALERYARRRRRRVATLFRTAGHGDSTDGPGPSPLAVAGDLRAASLADPPL